MSTCFPLIVYIFCIICVLFTAYHAGHLNKFTENNKHEIDYVKIVFHLITYAFCILLIKYLCNNNHTNIAWFVVFLPCIFMSISLLSISRIIGGNTHPMHGK